MKVLNSVILVLLLLPPVMVLGQAPIVFHNRRELFTDSLLIDRADHLSLDLKTPVSAGAAMRFEKPWEGSFPGYVSIVSDGHLYRMYYRGTGAIYRQEDSTDHKGLRSYQFVSGKKEVTCYAESLDGIHWIKPDLGLYFINGTYANNVVMVDNASLRSTHNFAVMVDTAWGVPASERFKAVGGSSYEDRPNSGLFRFVSPDGIHWRRYMQDTLPLFHDYALDSQNVLVWSVTEQCYVIYFRAWTGAMPGELYPKNGIRTIARSVSRDFIHWSKPVLMSFGNTQIEHLYTNATHPYYRAPQIMIATPFRFWPDKKILSNAELTDLGVDSSQWQGVSDAVFMTSRGGNSYDRTFLQSFIRPGLARGNWAARSNMPAMGVIPTGEGEMSFFLIRSYASRQVMLERMIFRTDGFSSLKAGYQEGYLITKPLRMEGDKLSVNISTSAAGYLRIILLDARTGNEIAGYGAGDAAEIKGDFIDKPVNWKSGAGMAALHGRDIRIKFIVKDADLYSFSLSDK